MHMCNCELNFECYDCCRVCAGEIDVKKEYRFGIEAPAISVESLRIDVSEIRIVLELNRNKIGGYLFEAGCHS